jgi:1,4-dihydroxy-2-naphthoate octaprenyltransferase
MPEPAEPSAMPPAWQRWLVAIRPWGIPISAVPVWMGSALAWVETGRFNILIFALTWLAALLVHSAANMLSDVFDYRRGVDREPTPTSGSLARGWLTERQTLRGGVVMMITGGAIGLWILSRSTPALGWVILAGGVTGLGYSGLKLIALGDLAVFLTFGPLIGLGAWMTQTGHFSWTPVLALCPFGLVVIGVLHANNWRDVARDRAAGVRSVAQLLGDAGSLRYYGLCIFAPYALMAIGMVAPRLAPALGRPLPWTFALTLLVLPRAFGLWRKARRRHDPSAPPLDFLALDGATAGYMMPFGLVSTAAVILSRWFGA